MSAVAALAHGPADALFLDEPEMRHGATAVAFISDQETREVVSGVLRQRHTDPLIQEGGSRQALDYLAEYAPPPLIIVDLGDCDGPVSAMLSLAAGFSGEVRVITIGALNDIELYRQLIAAGIDEYLVKPVDRAALSAALDTPRAGESAQTDQSEPRGERIVVTGVRGGTGASTVAAILAWLLAEESKKRTTLVDFDLEFGTLALSFDVEPSPGLREAFEAPDRIDALFLSSATVRISDRLALLTAEEAPGSGPEVSFEAAGLLLDTLGTENECVVVDVPRASGGARRHAIEAATRIVLVTELNIAGLRDTMRLLAAIERWAVTAPVTVLVNRLGGTAQALSRAEFEKALGRRVGTVVPADDKVFGKAVNGGKPLHATAGKSKPVAALRPLAAELAGEGEKSRKPMQWLKRLRTRPTKA